jgi:hypothetical protein
MMRWALVGLLAALPAHADVIPPGCGGVFAPTLVYTRQPRAQAPVGTMSDAANWQHANDISRVWAQSEADVVLDSNGAITVIHDCTSTADVCTAQEPRVSPDGAKIIYSVSQGKKLDHVVMVAGVDTGLREFDTVTAELWLYDIATGKSRRLSEGHIDRSPAWASNDLIVFASDRAGTYAPRSTLGRNFYPRPAFHIHRARITAAGLSDVTDITPAEHFAQSPEVLTTGEVVYSSWQGVAPREFGSTPQNHWWIQGVDINGNAPRSLLGAHGSGSIENYPLVKDWADPARRGEGATQYRGLRVVGELWPGYLAVVNYYRGNSLGAMGKIFGWQNIEPEGASLERNIPAVTHWSSAGNPGSARYVPSTLLNMTPYGTDQDSTDPIYHKDGRAAGRAGYPAPLPKSWGYGPDAWLYTHARGWCYEAMDTKKATVEAMGGEPTCKKQINVALVRQVKNPFDPAQTKPIACASLDYHCWDARAVASYGDLYGQDVPAIASITAPAVCELRVVNARMSELSPLPPPPGATPDKIKALAVAYQGNADPAYPAIVQSFGVEYFDPWRAVPGREGNAKDYPPVTAKLEQDGSVRLPVDCGRPFQHFGYDAKGQKIASGLAPMATFGPMTCHGCHDGHSEEIGGTLPDAAEAFKATIAGKK